MQLPPADVKQAAGGRADVDLLGKDACAGQERGAQNQPSLHRLTYGPRAYFPGQRSIRTAC
jgi:hypothetical protein